MRAPRTDSDDPRVEMLSGNGFSSQRREIHRVADDESGVVGLDDRRSTKMAAASDEDG